MSRLQTMLCLISAPCVLLALVFALGASAATASTSSCAPAGTWPGPNGPHFLNQFNDGHCAFSIAPVTFPDSTAGTPANLTMDTGTWTVQDPVEFQPGSTVTVDSGATIEFEYEHNTSAPNGYVFVNGGTMTFQPGSHAVFNCASCGLVVTEYLDSGIFGTLHIDGTAASPVTMSGPTPGSWGGIRIDPSTSADIDHLQLSNAGAATQPYASPPSTGIYVWHASPSISNTTVSGSSANGIEMSVAGSGTLSGIPTSPTLTNLTLTDNAGYPVQYDFLTSDLTKISGLTMSGNGHNGVHMISSTGSAYTADATWPKLGYPIIDDVATTVSGGATLTVAPGTAVQFGQGDGLSIASGGNLSALGTAAQQISFSSDKATPAAGDWPGISFADGALGSLSYAHVSYAGGSCGCTLATAVKVNNAAPSLDHTTVDHSSADGIQVVRGGQPLLHSMKLLTNGGCPLRYTFLPTNLGQFSGISASGNTPNALCLDTGDFESYTGTVSWPSFGVPYWIHASGISVQNGGHLTVAPGDTLEFVKNGGGAGTVLQVLTGSTLTMQGSAKNPIRLTSAQPAPAPGDWVGLRLLSGSSASVHDVTVSYAGGPGATPSTGIYVSGSSPNITNTTIAHSATDDLDVSGGTPALTYDSFLAVPNGKLGVANIGWSSGQPLLAAKRTWWGSNSGPRTTANPGGTGTPVGPGVSFSPWLSLAVSPSGGTRGSSATVSGTGYKPGETVEVRWACQSAACSTATLLATTTAAPDGSFSVGITIPSTATVGTTYSIGAIGDSSGAFTSTHYAVTS